MISSIYNLHETSLHVLLAPDNGVLESLQKLFNAGFIKSTNEMING